MNSFNHFITWKVHILTEESQNYAIFKKNTWKWVLPLFLYILSTIPKLALFWPFLPLSHLFSLHLSSSSIPLLSPPYYANTSDQRGFVPTFTFPLLQALIFYLFHFVYIFIFPDFQEDNAMKKTKIDEKDKKKLIERLKSEGKITVSQIFKESSKFQKLA